MDRNTFSTFVDFSDGGSNAFGLQTDTDGVTWQLYSSSNGVTNLFAATVGTWYFIAFAKGPNNGETQAWWADAATLALSTSGTTNHNQATTITGITYGESGFGGEWLNGSMAAVKIWAGVRLTQAEFERERFQYLPHRTSNLYGFYPFLQGGATAGARQDFSGSGNTLSNGTNSATTDGPPITWRQFQFNLASQITGSIPDPGGFWQLQENLDRWQLEEAESGLWLLEETQGDTKYPAGYIHIPQNPLIRM